MPRITNAAQTVIEKLGKGDFSKGLTLISDCTGINPIQIRRWTYPAERGGTDGRIPRKHHAAITARARRLGIAIAPEEFETAPLLTAEALRRLADQLDAEHRRTRRAAGAR